MSGRLRNVRIAWSAKHAGVVEQMDAIMKEEHVHNPNWHPTIIEVCAASGPLISDAVIPAQAGIQ